MNELHDVDTPVSIQAAAGALERLFELAVVLTGAMDTGLASRGLTRARAEVIWRLCRVDAMTQRELSQALRCTPRNVTGLIDALEAAGFVDRRPHPTDRRATHVGLTQQGLAAAGQMRAEYQDFGASLFAGLSGTQFAELNTIIDSLLGRLNQAGLAAG